MTECEERVYFVKDSAGNYYRLEDGQFVAAAELKDAEKFTQSEVNCHIGSGRKARFYSMIHMNEVNREQAEKMVKIGEYMITEEKMPASAARTYDIANMDWEDYLKEFQYFVDKMPDYRENLQKELGAVDQELSDIVHYIELYEMGDKEDAELVSLIKEARHRRRVIKDELTKTENFMMALGGCTDMGKVKNGIKQIKKLDKRIYVPRQLPELFEGAELQSPAKSLKQTTEAVRLFDNMESVEQQNTTGGMEMEYIRKATVYDGKSNDWLAFARMQLEFFDNAMQYTHNLQIELESVDEEVQNILVTIEDANYNGVQGYQVFRRLKELRVRRKEILKELEVLRILTEGFHMGDMLEICKYNLDAIEQLLGVTSAEKSDADSIEEKKDSVEVRLVI